MWVYSREGFKCVSASYDDLWYLTRKTLAGLGAEKIPRVIDVKFGEILNLIRWPFQSATVLFTLI